MAFEHFQIYLNWLFFNFWDNFTRYWGTGILIRVGINFFVVYCEKNEINVGTEWAYQLGVWGSEGGSWKPPQGVWGTIPEDFDISHFNDL